MSTPNQKTRSTVKVSLVVYDLVIFAAAVLFFFVYYRGAGALDINGVVIHTVIALLVLFGARLIGNIYRQIWRYGGINSYIRLLACDGIALVIYTLLNYTLPIPNIGLTKLISFISVNCLCAMSIRMVYRYAYKFGTRPDRLGQLLRWMLRVFTFNTVHTEPDTEGQKVKAAILGAGSVGVSLAEEMHDNPRSHYVVRCFIDNSTAKAGRDIAGISVIPEDSDTVKKLLEHEIQEIIFAVPKMDAGRKFELFEFYTNAGFTVKTYEYPELFVPGQRRQLRPFRIEDLLMRSQKELLNDATREYYKGKVILITGGGGSIGSELCMQLATMSPKQLILLDIYENGVYDVQQTLKIIYKDTLDVRVEICSIANKRALDRVFREYHPDICINSAAHKHVPLMEKNCIEAVENNVFGAYNVVRCCEEFGCGRFMMVSTDKAVNPTNVMGATKRLCEMIMQAYSGRGKVKCSATRFGNVMGSAGSVIPLFEKQIAAGGPVTLTDKRIIRYFMTIPEASQLVLISGAMARNGEIFVLDMGKPVKIYDLARSMIAMSGAENIEILETGLRPGEKLFEELLLDTETMEKTENELIFIGHEPTVTYDELYENLKLLNSATLSDDDTRVKELLHQIVPTFRTPEEYNAQTFG